MTIPLKQHSAIQNAGQDAGAACACGTDHEHDRAPAEDFKIAATRAAGDDRQRQAISNATTRQWYNRQMRLRDLPDANALRELAGQIKQHTLDHLDYYLQQTVKAVEVAGGKVHFAVDGAEARQIILDIAKQEKVTCCVKSKSMVSEEIELAQDMEAAGIDVVETDLGEFIVQISHDKPSHIVQPIIHKDRASIAKLFSEYFKTPYNDDPQHLTRQARVHLREKFRKAEMGITGGNFIVAESGKVCICTNEGNGRLSAGKPRVLVSLVGIEKLIPRMTDLSVMLKLLARSSTGQPITVYTSIFGGTRAVGEKDGPEQFHLVLLDNGRREILAGKYRETLRCIRCAACLNACPIYRKIGGHSYGSVYPGPIGALITPLFDGLKNYKDLPQASSLCGACYEACPVKINIPKHLIGMRQDMVQQRMGGPIERAVYRAWALMMRSPWMYRMMTVMQRLELRRRAKGSGWVSKLPMPGSAWTQVRDMPAPAKNTFRELWAKRSVPAAGLPQPSSPASHGESSLSSDQSAKGASLSGQTSAGHPLAGGSSPGESSKVQPSKGDSSSGDSSSQHREH